jgi:hypothetical protein
MNTLDFMRDMRKQFGHFEFRAEGPSGLQARTENCPTDPDHPFNRPDSEYVIPALDHRRRDEE